MRTTDELTTELARVEAELIRALRVASAAETKLERITEEKQAHLEYKRNLLADLGYSHNVSTDVVHNDLRHVRKVWLRHKHLIIPKGWYTYTTAPSKSARIEVEVPVYPYDAEDDVSYRAARTFEMIDPSQGGLKWRNSTRVYRHTVRDVAGAAVDVGDVILHPVDGRAVIVSVRGNEWQLADGRSVKTAGIEESRKVGTDPSVYTAWCRKMRPSIFPGYIMNASRDVHLPPPLPEPSSKKLCVICGRPGGDHSFPSNKCPASAPGKFTETQWVEPATSPDSARVRYLTKALDSLVTYIERQTCLHEETRRGGTNWEICDACGMKWADDKGGKPADAHEYPLVVRNARRALEAHGGEAV